VRGRGARGQRRRPGCGCERHPPGHERLPTGRQGHRTMSDKTEPPTGKDIRSTDMRSTRKRWLAIAGGIFVAIGVAWGAYWVLALRYAESTDDAYGSGNVVQITPQIPGTVVKIAADDTQFVKAGSTIV